MAETIAQANGLSGRLQRLRARAATAGTGRVAAYAYHRRVRLAALRFAFSRDEKFRVFSEHLTAGRALEIGGPTAAFATPELGNIYERMCRVDNVLNDTRTLWNGHVTSGRFGIGGRTLGRQFIAEASTLTPELRISGYDSVIASHALEHLANPLQALATWREALRPGGTIAVILPAPRATFDHRRHVTPLAHLIADRTADVDENDTTHLDEFRDQIDFNRVSPEVAPTRQTLDAQIQDNWSTRCTHHHVFDVALLRAMAPEAGLVCTFAADGGTDLFAVYRAG